MLDFGDNFNDAETSMQNTSKTTWEFWNTLMEIDRKDQEEREHPSYNKKKRD
jgi:hypothetical protein